MFLSGILLQKFTTYYMRLIWTTDNADHFRTFCSYLHAKGIVFTTEEQMVRDWSSDSYGNRKYLLWITEEDQVDTAVNALVRFIDNPSLDEFTKPEANDSVAPTVYLDERLKIKDEEVKNEFSGHVRLTAFVILLCSLIFLYEHYTNRKINTAPPEARQELLEITPVRKTLLYDFPLSYELLDKIVLLYGQNALASPQELPEPGKSFYIQFLKEPIFNGYYPYILSFAEEALHKPYEKNPPISEMPTFEKIREGEIWRFFSPALLHIDMLHLFFNMIWVLLLSSQIEARIGAFRLLGFMLIAAFFSNTAQYLMTGPNFVGFSGIICAMATYIRARQFAAPWEAYQMSSSTFAFIMFFIGLLAFLSVGTFIFKLFYNISLPIQIANTAHLVGAVVGYILGRTNLFSWKLQT